MKKLICAIVVIICSVCVASAGEAQEAWCGDKSLPYCISHFDKQCNAKNYGACGVVGDLHFEKWQYYESKKYYEMVCDKANNKSAFQVEMIDGSLTPKSATPETCIYLAKLYSQGLGVRQDYSKALQYSKKACDLGYADACGFVGSLYLGILGKNTKKDYKLAKNYIRKIL